MPAVLGLAGAAAVIATGVAVALELDRRIARWFRNRTRRR